MRLSEFLNYFDFDYEVVNGQVRLVDLQGVYLGDIGEDRFPISKFGCVSIVDRLEIYIKDYVTDDLEEGLIAAGVENAHNMDLDEMAKYAREKDVSCDLNIIDVILNPSLLEFEKERIIESFSVGQVFYEVDTKRYIVLENNDCGTSDDIWSFKVFDEDMQYLYDTTVFDARLANDIINGYVKSVTHERVLRCEPDCLLEWKGELSATLEETDKLWDRFCDYLTTENGELRYVTLDFSPKDNSIVFKLHYEKIAENNHDIIRNVLELPAESEEKELLLKEMRALKPEFFDKLEKPALGEAISAAEEQKGFCTPGFDFKIDKEGNER